MRPRVSVDKHKKFDNRPGESIRVLYVESDSSHVDRTLKHFALAAPNFIVKTASKISEAVELCQNPDAFDVVLADTSFSDGSALDLVNAIRKDGLELPSVVLTKKLDEKTAASALDCGVSGYIVKRGDYLSQVPFVIQNAVHRSRLERVNRRLQEQIEERNQAREALEATETKYRDIIERIPVVTYIADFGFDGNWYYVSPRIEVLLGFTAEELMTDATIWSRQIHPDDLETVRLLETRTRDTGQPFLCEYRIYTRLGNLRWVRDEAVAVHDNQGRPLYLQGVLSDITDVKLAAETIRTSEERLRMVALATNDAVWDWDLEANKVWWGNAFETLFGYSLHDVESGPESWTSRIHPDDLDRVMSGIDNVIAGSHQNWSEEYRFRKADGDYVYVYDRGFLIRDSADRPIRFIGAMMDITARKKSEEALREHAEYLAALHDTALGLMSRRNLDELLQVIVTHACAVAENTGGFVYLLESNGHTMRQQLGTGESAPYTGTCTSRGQGVTGKVWETGQPLFVNGYGNWPGRLRVPGIDLFHAVAGVPIKSNDTVIGVLGVESTDPNRWFSEREILLLQGFTGLASIAIDTTLAHKRLEEQEELFRVILNNIPAMVGIVQPNLDLKWVNRHFEQTLGFTFEDARQTFFKDVFPDSSRRKEAIEFLQLGDAKWRDFELRLRDGRAMQIASASVRISDGNFIVIGQDVTERMIAEKNRQHMEEQLRQIQKIEAIGRLAGGVAHDFNNLLMVITGYSELVMMQTPESDHRHKMLAEIYRAAEQGADLTRQLLAFSRKQVLEPRVFDLNEIIREIGNMVGRLIGEDIQLATRLQATRGRITADKNQLHQVIMNLAVNARDAMPMGGKLMLQTSNIDFDGASESLAVSPPAGSYVELLVRDTGEGMDEATQARIFEPFFTTKEKGKGTGLGLATVYGIIKQSKGYIYVHSTPGEGTTFQILFPSIGEKEELAENLQPPIETGIASETVLLVDDNEPARSAVAALLEMKGYSVIQAGDPREALAVTRTLTRAPDLLVTDVVMPYGSGRELAVTLSEKYPGLKILYLSGYTEDAVSRDGVLEEGTTFLSKPVSVDLLLRKIRELLDR